MLTERERKAVEAIRSEIERQRNEDHMYAPYADCDHMSDATLDGHFDLEAVARAVVGALDAENCRVSGIMAQTPQMP